MHSSRKPARYIWVPSLLFLGGLLCCLWSLQLSNKDIAFLGSVTNVTCGGDLMQPSDQCSRYGVPRSYEEQRAFLEDRQATCNIVSCLGILLLISGAVTWIVRRNPRLFKPTASQATGLSVRKSGEDTFEPIATFNNLEEFFDAIHAQKFGKPSIRLPGADVRYALTITEQEAASGCHKEIEVSRLERCETCYGSCAQPGTPSEPCPVCQGVGEIRQERQSTFGQFFVMQKCERCQGRGRLVTAMCECCRGQGKRQLRRRLTAYIPAGVKDGSLVRFLGEGEPSSSGGQSGNLYIILTVKA